MYKCVSFSLLATSFAFATDANANLGPIMADATVDQGLKMIPLFVLAVGIAIFFALVQKNPQKAAVGCGGSFAIAAVLGLIIFFLDFISRHAVVFIILAVGLSFICLISFMINSPPARKKLDRNDPQDDVNNPF